MDFLKHQPHVDLGGRWLFAFRHAGEGREFAGLNSMDQVAQTGMQVRPCTVPGNFELDLQASGLIPEPFFGLNALELRKYEDCHVWYGRRFDAARRPGQTAELVFEGVDCLADIYLNGRLLGSVDNMLVEHVFAVDEFLRGDNELLVHIRPAVAEAAKFPYPPGTTGMSINYESLYIRKAPHSYGWDIMPRVVSAGLWRPVKLRYRPAERIEQVYLETFELADDLQSTKLRLTYKTYLARAADLTANGYELAVEGRCGDSTFSHRYAMQFCAGQAFFTVHGPRLWWPAGYGRPDLYDVTVTLLKGGRELDSMPFTHGIRRVELVRTSTTDEKGSGEFCLKVNGHRIFCKGPNWVPGDAFHSRDAARIPAIIDLAAGANCNILRCWGGNVYESDEFFDLCDRKGIMVWQDFAMACAVYPQDEGFRRRLADEAGKAVRRLRQHASLVLWAGDNECDSAYSWFGQGDPNRNVLTRQMLPDVLRLEDPSRPYLPSSPHIDASAFRAGEKFLPENHLWGPRDYYKSQYYRDALCHFASEIGYQGCPSVDSIRKFISPERLWPRTGNPEWILHSTNPTLTFFDPPDVRVELMARQIRELFGTVPETLEDFAFASQATQAEAFKTFIERFRAAKWRRTGIIWWNLMDGWPQFSDAVVDYYFTKKLAYNFIKTSQEQLCLMVRDEDDGRSTLVAANDTLADVPVNYEVRDIDSGAVVASGQAIAQANSATALADLPGVGSKQAFLMIEWRPAQGPGPAHRNHYLAGAPPFDLEQYRQWLAKAGISVAPVAADG
ncbi:MAG: glycoside hydrolase family 2 protein [Phycisphaerae bacterium]